MSGRERSVYVWWVGGRWRSVYGVGGWVGGWVGFCSYQFLSQSQSLMVMSSEAERT